MYRFRNLGSGDLVVRRVQPNCRCIDAKVSKPKVSPGGDAVIELRYRLEGPGGSFCHKTTVETNDPALPVITLKAGGFAGAAVEVNPPWLDLGEAVEGQAARGVCFVKYSGDQARFSINEARCALAGASVQHYLTKDVELMRKWWPKASTASRVSPGAHAIEVSFTPVKQEPGEIESSLLVRTDIEGFQEISIPVLARVVSRVTLRPSVVSFGKVSPGTVVERSVVLTPRVDRPYRVVGTEPKYPGLNCCCTVSPVRGETTLRLQGEGSRLLGLAGCVLRIRVQFVDSGEEVFLPLGLSAWR
jgi:hypothetical protein